MTARTAGRWTDKAARRCPMERGRSASGGRRGQSERVLPRGPPTKRGGGALRGQGAGVGSRRRPQLPRRPRGPRRGGRAEKSPAGGGGGGGPRARGGAARSGRRLLQRGAIVSHVASPKSPGRAALGPRRRPPGSRPCSPCPALGLQGQGLALAWGWGLWSRIKLLLYYYSVAVRPRVRGGAGSLRSRERTLSGAGGEMPQFHGGFGVLPPPL